MGDSNGGFGDVEIFGEELDESSVSLAVVRLGAEIDGQLIFAGFNDFFL